MEGQLGKTNLAGEVNLNGLDANVLRTSGHLEEGDCRVQLSLGIR